MRIITLRLKDFRLFDEAELRLGPGMNLLLGDNGGGKTSVLEAVHLLSRGRSFRGGAREALIRQGERELQVFTELETASGSKRLGLARSAAGLSARLNERALDPLSDLFQHCKAVCFEPGSHVLIAGGSEPRRELIDWGVFHVEPDFLANWRRYQRALRQRNHLLKAQGGDSALSAFEWEMASSGLILARHRENYLAGLLKEIPLVAGELMREFGPPTLRWQNGWPTSEALDVEGVAASLASQREADRQRGHTRFGPHRADWSLGFEAIGQREHFSRGQQKLAALLMVLSQAQMHARIEGEWPILLLDDLGSELDRGHCSALLDWVQGSGAQSLLSATRVDTLALSPSHQAQLFHVEQGQVRSDN